MPTVLVQNPRAIDANHTHVWRLDDAASATTFASATGGTALTPANLGSWIRGDGGLYRTGRCVRMAPGFSGATGTENASAVITPPSGSISIEVDFMFATNLAMSHGASQTAILTLNNDQGNYLYVRPSWSSGASSFMGGWKPDGSAEQATAAGFAGANIDYGVPHHALLSVSKGSGSANGTMSLYLDGVLVGSASSIRDAGLTGGTWNARIGNTSNNLAPIGRYGEFRISNIARDATYAADAYAALRSRW